MNRELTLLGGLGIGGLGIGAALMYMLDPDRGRRRRALVRDKLLSAANRAPDAVGATARDLSNRARGFAAEVGSMFTSEEVSDEVLKARVRSKMGRVVSHPHSVEVAADQGRVTLSGLVLAHEVDELLSCVSAVPGVTEVDSRLEVHKEAGDLSSLWPRPLRGGTRKVTFVDTALVESKA